MDNRVTGDLDFSRQRRCSIGQPFLVIEHHRVGDKVAS